jgi:hypothetical protein
MIKIIKNENRGRTKIDWLNSYHSFSFGNYFDYDQMNFGPLRVINEDFIEPDKGFPTHPHHNMEIITYVLEGALKHKDSTGTSSVIKAGDLQKMSAGKGVFHSEFNPSKTDRVHLFQIWIVPDKLGINPYYEQYSLNKENMQNKLFLVASNEKVEGKVFINQDAKMYLADIEKTKQINYKINNARGVYLHLINGEISAGGMNLSTGDAAAISDEENIEIKALESSELILFDVIMNSK